MRRLIDSTNAEMTNSNWRLRVTCSSRLNTPLSALIDVVTTLPARVCGCGDYREPCHCLHRRFRGSNQRTLYRRALRGTPVRNGVQIFLTFETRLGV